MRTAMIQDYILQLTQSLGKVRMPVDDGELEMLFKNKNYAGMVAKIRTTMNVQCRIRVGLVNSGGLSAPAWVEIPDNLPMAGTRDFKATRVTMYMRKSFAKEAIFEELVFAIAHELAHIVLESIRHPLCRQEEAVDLTAMLLGYRDFYVTGCQHHTQNISSGFLGKVESTFANIFGEPTSSNIHTIGYLQRDEVLYAARYMSIGK